MRFLAPLLFILAQASPREALANRSLDDALCRRRLQREAAKMPDEEPAGISNGEMQAFFKFVDKRVAPSMDPTERLRYEYVKRQSANLLKLSVCRSMPRVLRQQSAVRDLVTIPPVIAQTANAMIQGIYEQALHRRQYWMSTLIFEKSFNSNGNPALKTLTEWMIQDLPLLSPVEQLRAFLHCTVGLHAHFVLPEKSTLEIIPIEILTLLDHPSFHAWLGAEEPFSWLLKTPDEIEEMLYPGLSESVAESILPIVVGLSRSEAGRKVGSSLLSSPIFQGEDTALAREWLRLHEEGRYDEASFHTMALIRQKLEDSGTDIVVRTFFNADIALSTETANRMREYALHEMPVDSPLAKVKRTWVWVAAYDFAQDFFNPSMISEGIFENDIGISRTSALAFLNRSIRFKEPIEPHFLKRIFEVDPEHFVRPQGQDIALRSLTAKDLPWLLQNSRSVPPPLLRSFLNKTIPEMAVAPVAEPFIKIRWEPKELEALLATGDGSSNPDLVASSMYWLAQTIRLRPVHAVRVFDWLVNLGQKHRLAPKVRELLLANIGFKRLLEAVSRDLSFDRLQAFDRHFGDQMAQPENADRFIATLFSRADEIEEAKKLRFLEFIASVIEKVGAWPRVISGLSSTVDRDSATYTAASAVYLSKETGRRGIRTGQTRAVFDEGVALGHSFALLVPPMTTERSRPRDSGSFVNTKASGSDAPKTPPKVFGFSNPNIVTPNKSSAELLDILRNTQKSYVAAAAADLLLKRNDQTFQDFGSPAEFSQLLDLVKWQLSARNHVEVAERLFQLVLGVIEGQFLFELDETIFKSWSEYYLAYANQYPIDSVSAEALFLWLESVPKHQAQRLLVVLRKPIAGALTAPPTEPYLNYLSSWFQAKARAQHPGHAGFAAAIVAPAFMSPALSADIQRAAFYSRDHGKQELYELFTSLKAPALYPISKLIVKGHPHFSFSGLKSESGLLKHGDKLRAENQKLVALHGPKLPAGPTEKQQRLNEELAVVAAFLHELKHNRIPWEVDGLVDLGYDLVSLDPLTGQVRRIEVKSGYGEAPIAHISTNELKVCASTQTSGAVDYYFYLVDTRRALSRDEPLATIKLIKNPVVAELRSLTQADDSVPRDKLLRFAVQE